MTDADCVVIGAGVAGLAAAATLRRHGRDVIVLEASARAGGSAWTERIDGHLVERGPNTFRIPPAMGAFLREHGLASRLQKAEPASRERFLVRRGQLVPVPMNVAAFARTPLLTRGGKLRLLAEPFQPAGDPTGESVAEFTKRRLGCEARDGLVAPFLTGVYAGDENQLGAEAVFPTLVAAERRSGSIVRGLLANAMRGAGSKGSWGGTWSTANGIAALTDALAVSLDGALRLASRASSIGFEDGVYRIEVEEESRSRTIRCKALVLALPAQPAAALLAALDREAGDAIGAVDSAPVASVALSLASDATRVPLRGFGYLVPRGEGELLLGCLFSSQLFAGRAPPGREVLTLLAAGRRKPDAIEWSDEKLVAALLAEIEPVLGLREAPRVLAISRWPRAVAQPGRDHPRLIAGVRARLAQFPRLALAGSHLDGVAFGEALASGARAAQQVMEER